MNRTSSKFVLWLVASTAAIAASFWPALNGSFLFDDFANLKALGEYGPIKDMAGVLRYLTAGIADPLGRPVAMASFLIDARDWPADPAPFLRSNLVIHITNSLLLALALARLGRVMGIAKPLAGNAAIAGSALWALHPLWVSTVGYVVQRHAMLACTFVLLGILAWLLAVSAFRRGQWGSGWLYAGLAMPICGVLAALSKGNGMLLPLLVLSIQYFMLAGPNGRLLPERHAVRILLIFPSLVLALALLASINPEPAGRPWSLAERLMSQPRALVDYLTHLVIPRVNSTGLFADGFAVSRSWLVPWTTLPAFLFILALAVAPFLLRRRHPAWAGAIAFFLAGHVMESTVLPLELYFEHRNYLPAMLLGWPLALHLLSHRWQVRTGRPVLGVLLLALVVVTFQRATLWADAPRQAAVWARTLPDSPRAQTWAAQHEIERGESEAAERRLLAALENHPRNLVLAVNLVDAQCAGGEVTAQAVQRTETALAQVGAGNDVAWSWLMGKIQHTSTYCPEIEPALVDRVLQASATGSAGSDLAASRQSRLEGMWEASRGNCARARQHFEAAQLSRPWASEAYGDAALLASHCGPREALLYLEPFMASHQSDAAERPGMLRLHQWVLRRQGLWQSELLRLHSILRTEASVSPAEKKGE